MTHGLRILRSIVMIAPRVKASHGVTDDNVQITLVATWSESITVQSATAEYVCAHNGSPTYRRFIARTTICMEFGRTWIVFHSEENIIRDERRGFNSWILA
jgi:hypothetical protein